ncbi:MAG: leucine-rich repeat domain-containing protein, partial [Treponema sp.]|nr:leucine-rich repeat domain-containing protein [Treponema sp.]
MEEKNFEIEDGVLFKYTGNEKDVVIPAYVKKIYRYAFDGCTSVETISIPAGVMEIGTDMYSYYEECFEEMFDDDDYEQYDLPEICWGAFEGCTSLKEIRYGGT